MIQHGEDGHVNVLKVFVTDGTYKHTLAAVRSLAARGVEVHVGSDAPRALCFYSKHVKKTFLYPPPTGVRFQDRIRELDEIEDYDVILPIGSEPWFSFATSACDHIRRKIPMPPLRSYLIACNKAKTFAHFRRSEIPMPRTILPEDPERQLTSLNYPVVVKPGLGSGGIRIAINVREAMVYYKVGKQQNTPFVIQEYVRGDGYGFFALYNQGKMQQYFMHRRIRESPPTGGPSSAAESVYDDRLVKLGSKVLDSLSWHGVAMVEFKRDITTDEFKLIEINPKFWGSLDLAIAAGIDFPYLAARMVVTNKVEMQHSYRRIRFCWPLPDDLRHARAKPSSAPCCLRDWLDVRVKKDILLTDLGPHLILSLILFGKQMRKVTRAPRKILRVGPKRFSWIISETIAASAMPTSTLQLVGVRARGIESILDLTETKRSENSLARRLGLRFKQVPMADHMAPKLGELKAALDFVTFENSHGRSVLVHCLGGLGRTGTVLACYLVKNRKMDPYAAIAEVRSKRPGSIETQQEKSVVRYFDSVRFRSSAYS
jgi:predicted ATP-grasp superfamily ATP-dependent carboligase/predicted protein tyrosine phosphatase